MGLCSKCGGSFGDDGRWPGDGGDICLMCWEAYCGDTWHQWWGSARAFAGRTENGGALHVWKKIRPRWYWFICRVWLFALIVWRKPDDDPRCSRMDWSTAWNISNIVFPVIQPPRVQK